MAAQDPAGTTTASAPSASSASNASRVVRATVERGSGPVAREHHLAVAVLRLDRLLGAEVRARAPLEVVAAGPTFVPIVAAAPSEVIGPAPTPHPVRAGTQADHVVAPERAH